MHATLVYNPKSGAAAEANDLLRQLARIDWRVDRCVQDKELDDWVCDGAEVVVVAGGDGTVGRVAKRLVGTAIPMAIVPTGTANNVARSLGMGIEASSAVLRLPLATECHIDLGVVTSHRRIDHFIESFGVGMFATVVNERNRRADKKPKRALAIIADELEEYKPHHFELEVDGIDCSGQYVLAAVMNAQSLGPALVLAPEAKCDDGVLDVVLVRPDAKRALVSHLRRVARAAHDKDVALPAFETVRAKQVLLRADGRWAHVDSKSRQLEGETTIRAAAGLVKILLPPQAPANEGLALARKASWSRDCRPDDNARPYRA